VTPRPRSAPRTSPAGSARSPGWISTGVSSSAKTRLRRGHRALVEVQRLAEPGQRPEQPLGQEDEHAVRPHRDRRPHRLHPAESRVAVKPTRITMRISGTKAALHADRARGCSRGRRRSRAGPGSSLELLGGVRLDGRDAAQVVHQPRVQHADLLAHRGVVGREPPLEPDGAPDHRRHREHRHPGDLGGEQEEGAADHQHGGRHLQQLVGADVRKRSSWLTSSLSTDISPPVLRSSK
jgi:hypothetical protein